MERVYNETEVKALKLLENVDLDEIYPDELDKYMDGFISSNLEKKYDAIVFNESCSEIELKLFKYISNKVEHDVEIEIGDCSFLLHDLEINAEDYLNFYNDDEILNGLDYGDVYQEITRAYTQMEDENKEYFSYRYIKKTL